MKNATPYANFNGSFFKCVFPHPKPPAPKPEKADYFLSSLFRAEDGHHGRAKARILVDFGYGNEISLVCFAGAGIASIWGAGTIFILGLPQHH